MSCLITTPEIRELTKSLVGETEESVKGLVQIWQERNNRSIEEYPTSDELRILRSKLRTNQSKGVRVTLSTQGYRKGDPQRNPDVNYVFTENAEAYSQVRGIDIEYGYDVVFPYRNIPKLNVSDVNGTNQAGIRTDVKGNISENAFGIVVKKYQQDAKGKFVAREGQFQDTDSDFKLFTDLNEDMFDRLLSSSNKTILFPTQMGLGKAALPKRFAEWLQNALLEEFGISSIVEKNTRSDYDGYGLKLISVGSTSQNNIETKGQPTTWARTSDNGYEVSTKGDKRFSALVATFAPGTIIDGVDVSGMTIEQVYQNIIKKSGKGKAPATNSIVNLDRSREDGYPLWIDDMDKLPNDLKHKLYGIYTGNYEAAGMEVPKITKEDKEDFSYYMGYLPLWKEWADQNPDLMAELKSKTAGRTLTDQFANTRVSQARALSEILNSRVKIQPPAQQNIVQQSNAFDAPSISMEEQQRMVDLVFDPTQRRDRVTLIARFFSDEVDKAMEEVSAKLKRDIETTTDPAERIEKEGQLAGLTRFEVIKQYTPKGIFDRIKNMFESYANDTHEGRVQAELDRINSLEWADEYSEEEKLAAAQKKAVYKGQEYQKVVDHFNALAQEASTILRMTEGIRLDPDYVAPSDVNFNEDDPEGESQTDENADDYTKEESYKDGWMTNVRQVSVYESLAQEVRKAIREIPKLDYEGFEEEDDLGFKRYLDADYVHATLLDKLRNMITSEDMIPLLSEFEKVRPWVGQVIEILNNDDKLFSQFYQDFRKDMMSYWIQKKRQAPDGSFKVETIALNKPEGVYYLLDAWRDNYESGSPLDKDSVYNKNGEMNKANAAIGLGIVEGLNNQFINLSTEQRLQLLNDPKVWGNIMKVLHMIGIDANPATLRTALTNIQEAPGIEFTDPIMLLIPQLNVVFSGIIKGEVKSETRVDGTVKRGDLINTFGSAYNMIAKMMADVTEDAIESSVRENGKFYYSHVTPSYLGKLIKQLKNVMHDKERFDRFIQTEFKDYEWFFKDDHWRSDWVEKLATDPKMREALDHKVVLNFDKIDYVDWDPLDYTLVLLNEYWAEPKEGRSWYHVSMLSDSPSAEFIRFVRYKNGSEYDDEGNPLSYQDIILDKMVDLVNQEYDRIQLVRQRDVEYQKGNPNVEPIANFDIIRKSNGDIKSLGGSVFKFLPALNDLRFGNETFEQRIAALKETGSGADLRTFIKETLSEVMEQQFEDNYSEWAKMGLLEELPNGKYKYLPFSGQSSRNKTTAKSLLRAKTILGTTWTNEMDALLRDVNNNNPIIDRKANEIINKIKELLDQAATIGDISLDDVNSIIRGLRIDNAAKEALREYFWNSKHATSQIIQITTTDLAFFKDMEEFYKRNKEIHAPSLRLNTKATYKGERVGRDWERTIYLQDDEIVSASHDDIKEVLEEKVKKGELSRASMNYILKQFTKVNVADAQAYRSMDSYRAVMVMSGQWTDAMEQAYKNFKEGTWNIEDFSVIWQTKKPYVYTQVNNTSGIEGHTGIKTPVQHKNSEFLLLAMHDLIAGPLKRSQKLRAINKFMQENNIDVVQFESTTKVGKQGVINLNNVNSEEEVLKVLREQTGIGIGAENPNVVHKVSYEDYGIQTATPEHGIDAVQLVGTQIRKLITADISPDAIIEINGKSMTKQEWLDFYNAINTENILQKFAEISEEFKDPKNVEKLLLDEIRGNARYGQDMIKACTLNEKGHFTIPLYDPVQSQRVQQLLNSIIKSRVTKQKIKGGALIQVSSYGLSDQLNIVWEGEGANKRIKYLECYMPAYSKQFYKPLMKQDADGNYYLDVNGLDDDLRKLIGYRV